MGKTALVVFLVIFIILFIWYQSTSSSQATAQAQEYTAQLQVIQGISQSNNVAVGQSGIMGLLNNLVKSPAAGTIIKAL